MNEMLTRQQISRYRQEFRSVIREIDRLSSRCLFPDPLIKGTPGRVFRSCGKKSCKCANNKEERHGPYKVLQVFRNGHQRQITIKKDQDFIWNQAKHFQHQMKCLYELKEKCQQLQAFVTEIIDKRTKEFP